MAEPPEQQLLVLTLYVADSTPASLRARRQLETWMAASGGDGVRLEVIDVLDRPEAAEAERIIATPTLVRHHPPPRRKIIGDLGDWDQVASQLDLSWGAA